MPKKQKERTSSLLQRYIADGKAKAARYRARRPHRSFRITPTPTFKRGKKLAGTWQLVGGTFATIWQEKRRLGTLGVMFVLAILIVVGAISQISFVDIRQATHELFSGDLGALGSVTTLFTAAVTGSLNPTITPLQQFLAVFLVFLFWLAIVWVLRKRLSDQSVTVREALYSSGGPIIPSVIVAMALIFQCVPGALGLIAAALTLNGVWLPGGVESMVVTVAAGLLCLISLYLVCGSALALIIITLPGMYPWRALAVASDLVIGQRWRLVLRFLIMIVVVLLVWALVLIPAILLDSWLKFNWLPLIPALVLVLYGFTLVYCSTYVYKMYRSML